MRTRYGRECPSAADTERAGSVFVRFVGKGKNSVAICHALISKYVVLSKGLFTQETSGRLNADRTVIDFILRLVVELLGYRDSYCSKSFGVSLFILRRLHYTEGAIALGSRRVQSEQLSSTKLCLMIDHWLVRWGQILQVRCWRRTLRSVNLEPGLCNVYSARKDPCSLLNRLFPRRLSA